MVVDENGQGLYSTGLRHGDSMHISDMSPECRDDQKVCFAALHVSFSLLWKEPFWFAPTRLA